MKIEVAVYIETDLLLSIGEAQALFAHPFHILLSENPDIKSAMVGGLSVAGFEQ
jgi:hypothetical protein